MNYPESVALAESIPDSAPPLVVDIDGTLTDDRRALDPRTVPVLRDWPAPVVVATGKAMPYPVALCEFLGIEIRVIAENGGVVVLGRDTLVFEGDHEAAQAVAREYRERGHSLGWGKLDLVNRWRETELAVSRESPLDPLETIANDHGLVVIDSGYAYHVKSPDVNKGTALETVAEELDIPADAFVAIGDSENDAPIFEVVKTGIAVGNADQRARRASDHVTDETFGDGFLEAIEFICNTISS